MIRTIVAGTDGSDPAQRAVVAAPLEAAQAVWCTELHNGAPATVLADVARETRAQLLVVGNRGAHPESTLFLGTTAHGLAHRTPVALLVVPVVQHVASIGDRELMALTP
ncbi:MAG: universal stress protein [Candidatus Dormibacteria bacterium]